MIVTLKEAKKLLKGYTAYDVFLLGKEYLHTFGESYLWGRGKCVFWGLKVLGIDNVFVDFPHFNGSEKKHPLTLLLDRELGVWVRWQEKEGIYVEGFPF